MPLIDYRVWQWHENNPFYWLGVYCFLEEPRSRKQRASSRRNHGDYCEIRSRVGGDSQGNKVVNPSIGESVPRYLYCEEHIPGTVVYTRRYVRTSCGMSSSPRQGGSCHVKILRGRNSPLADERNSSLAMLTRVRVSNPNKVWLEHLTLNPIQLIEAHS